MTDRRPFKTSFSSTARTAGDILYIIRAVSLPKVNRRRVRTSSLSRRDAFGIPFAAQSLRARPLNDDGMRLVPFKNDVNFDYLSPSFIQRRFLCFL